MIEWISTTIIMLVAAYVVFTPADKDPAIKWKERNERSKGDRQ